MKYIFVFLFVLSTNLGFSQNQYLSKDVRNDFCINAVYNYKYGSDAFKAWMIKAARSIGLNSIIDIEVAVENIYKHQDLQEEFFKNIVRIGGSRDFIFMQFNSIGMRAENAKFLADYALNKYGYKQNVSNEEKKQETYIEENYEISKYDLLNSVYPKSVFENDSMISRKENALNIDSNGHSIGHIDVEYKTEVLKEFTYTVSSNNINVDDDERIAVVFASYDSELENRHNCSKCYPMYTVAVFKKDEKYWKLIKGQRVTLNGNKLNDKKDISKIKMELDGGKYFLIFENGTLENRREMTYLDLNTLEVDRTEIFSNSDIEEKGLGQQKINELELLRPNKSTNKTSSSFFNGTKKFCDTFDDIWESVVTISNNNISINIYAGKKNTYYKNKAKILRSATGKIINGKIYTKKGKEYIPNEFKIESGIFYELNDEGGYNSYKECK